MREIENPCPKLYEPLVDLEFFSDLPVLSRRMRVFARRDLTYGEPLRKALTDGWPAPYVRQSGWQARYDDIFGVWFGR